MKRSSSRRNRGFTLIEVLLVLVILVILASLAVVNVLSVQKSANVKAAQVQIDGFDTALGTYQMSIGTFPTTQSGLQALRTRPNDLQDPDKWEGPYITKDIPLDPWGKPYQYSCPGMHNPDRFDVWTVTPPPENKELGNWTEEVRR